jgi:hypothetical protein
MIFLTAAAASRCRPMNRKARIHIDQIQHDILDKDALDRSVSSWQAAVAGSSAR